MKSAALGVLGSKAAGRRHKEPTEADVLREFVCLSIGEKLGRKFDSVNAALDALFNERQVFKDALEYRKREEEKPLTLGATFLRKMLRLPENVVLEVHTPFEVFDGEGIELDDKDVLLHVKPRLR